MARILVVEDDPDVSRLLQLRLKSAGYETVFARDAVTTLKTARDAAPDLILLDLGLPGGDGFIVMERLKTVDALAFVPVVVISARDPRVSEQAALDAGAVAFLAKPIDVDELLDVVRATLG